MIYDKDHARIVLIVVTGLGLVMLALYGVIAGLLFGGRAVPGELWQASGAALGAFSALLVKTTGVQAGEPPVDEVPNDSGSSSTTVINNSGTDVVAAGGVDPDTLGGHDAEAGASLLGIILAVVVALIVLGIVGATHSPLLLVLLLLALACLLIP